MARKLNNQHLRNFLKLVPTFTKAGNILRVFHEYLYRSSLAKIVILRKIVLRLEMTRCAGMWARNEKVREGCALASFAFLTRSSRFLLFPSAHKIHHHQYW